MWLRKSARQGAAENGAEWEVVAMVRVVFRVRERSARRRVGAMVAAVRVLCWIRLELPVLCLVEKVIVNGKNNLDL
jgi:hypothetical protein